jgi:hypothetical protein
MIRRLALFSLVILACMQTESARAERSVVLVTGDECEIESLTMLEIRKAYFGLIVRRGNLIVRAFRLSNDEKLNRIFFQSVVAMSEKSYERRLRSMLLKYGSPRPLEFSNVRALSAAVRTSNCGIAYMWQEDLEQETGLRSIRLLWQGD